jgi:hypothetical protein
MLYVRWVAPFRYNPRHMILRKKLFYGKIEGLTAMYCTDTGTNRMPSLGCTFRYT